MKAESIQQSSRIVYLDVAKGLGIIFVVWAHAKGPYSGYMYLFHMPLFFLISGYLHNSKKTFMQFLTSKFKTIYLPFIFWNELVTVIKTVLHPKMAEKNIKLGIEILLTLGKDGQFFGATWFLGALFVISILYKFLDTYIRDCKYKYVFITGCFMSLAIVGFEINFPFMISRTLVLGLFYAIGYWIKRNSVELEEFDRPLLAIMAFGLFIIQGHYNSANMGANTYKYYFSFVFGALCASYGMIFLSRLICEVQSLRYLKNVLCYLSEKSIDIVIWQFVAFRLVIALQLYIEKISLKTILDYYPVYDVSDGWWLIYTVIGILVPILLGCVFHMPTNCKALICKSMLKREKVK